MSLSPAEHATHPVRAVLRARVERLLAAGASNEGLLRLAPERDALLADIAAFQAAHVAPWARLCAARGARFDAGPDSWPALPTDVYRHARVSVFDAGADRRVFKTSGTTSGARGEHPFVDLALYDRAAMLGAQRLFLPEGAFDLLVLAADPARQPESSLGHMLGLFAADAAQRSADAAVAFVFDGEQLDVAAIERSIAGAVDRGRTLVVCGTSFAFVFAEDVLTQRFALPPGSRVMFTGGYKGRSRELDEATLRQTLCARFGVGADHVVTEYGMTELSSQLWSRELLDRGVTARGGRLWAPPWMRVTVVEPTTLAPLPDGEAGILRFDDVANLDSCVSVQTADRGFIDEIGGIRGVVLLGRDPSAVPRGCSLAIEEALSSRGARR